MKIDSFFFFNCYSLKTKTRRDLLLEKYERERTAEGYEKL